MLKLLPVIAAIALSCTEAQSHDCKCMANQRIYEQGQTACIKGRLARCGMALNNSSWIFLASSCPEARRPTLLATLLPSPKACFR